MDFLLTVYRIAQAALGVGLVIFVHEAGHYFAARLCGVRVEVFSLGFGPRIWGRQIGSTLYQIALVPFGGYVRMAGDDFTGNADRTRDPLPDELMGKRPLQRFFIYSGGVVMNVVFAIVVFPLALLAGVPSLMPVIGEPSTGSPLWLAHLEPGTRIEEVNGVVLPSGQQTKKYRRVVLPMVTICGFQFYDTEFLVSRFEKSWGIDALIGLDLFRQTRITIDYESSNIVSEPYNLEL
jgi:RIP metalloprotease RseP